jgi:hypothetical protein
MQLRSDSVVEEVLSGLSSSTSPDPTCACPGQRRFHDSGAAGAVQSPGTGGRNEADAPEANPREGGSRDPI